MTRAAVGDEWGWHVCCTLDNIKWAFFNRDYAVGIWKEHLTNCEQRSLRSSGDDVDVDDDYDCDDWDMEEEDGEEEESWPEIEQIYWIENVVQAQRVKWHRCPHKYCSVAVKQIIILILASVTSRGVVNLKHWRKYQIGMREILMVENRQIQSHQSDISAQKQRQ